MATSIKKNGIEKRKSERIYELKNALAYAKAIVNTIRAPLVVLYPKLTISSANKAFYKTFKTDAEEAIGRHLYEIGNKQFDIPLLKKLLQEILSKKRKFNDFEIENNFISIGHKVLILNAQKLKIAGKEDQMILLAIEDITERRSLEKKVEVEKNTVVEQKHSLDLAQQKVDFITITSHELKTPATCIKAYTQLLQMEFAPNANAETKALLTNMNTQMDNLTHLIDNLLETTEIKGGKLYAINQV